MKNERVVVGAMDTKTFDDLFSLVFGVGVDITGIAA
jgi:hypothetical protein